MKTILVPAEDHDSMPAVLETARLVARRFDSYVEGFAVHPAASGLRAGRPCEFFAPFAWAIGFLMDRAMNHRFTHPKQFVTIRQMLLHPFTIHSPDPAYSDLVVEQIRERLAVLKAIISGSAEMREKQTYEL